VQKIDETQKDQDRQDGLGLVGAIRLSQSHSAGDVCENAGGH
jgi:hypothetical protein